MLVRHEVQQYTNPAALTAETNPPTKNDEVHIESLNRRFNWLEGATTTADNIYVIEQTSEASNGRWAATAVDSAKVFTGSGATGAIPNGNTAVFTVTLSGTGTLLANSGAALGITNAGSFPTNVFLDSLVLTADNTVQVTVVNERGSDVSAFNVDVKAIDYTGVAAAAAAATPKQTEFGSCSASTTSYQTYIVRFTTPFSTVPFITVTSNIREDSLSWKALNVTTTGFIIEGFSTISEVNFFTGAVTWKAEEK